MDSISTVEKWVEADVWTSPMALIGHRSVLWALFVSRLPPSSHHIIYRRFMEISIIYPALTSLCFHVVTFPYRCTCTSMFLMLYPHSAGYAMPFFSHSSAILQPRRGLFEAPDRYRTLQKRHGSRIPLNPWASISSSN